MMVGAGLVLAACGGGEKAPAPAAEPAAAPAVAPAGEPMAGGTVHDVQMVLEGTSYKFVPNDLTIKAGDKVVFHNVSGGPHNVQFWADSIPAGSAAALDAAMTGDKLGELNGPLLSEPNQTYEISFAGLAGGEYKFTCTPHMAMGMNGKITVTQ
ncbi:MAG: plastocyanin/azurin family copper-binding protein [Gemmatimonadales bacterium]